MHRPAGELVPVQRRVLRPLDNDQFIGIQILAGDVPGALGAVRLSPDAESTALAQGVEGQSLVRSKGSPLRILYGAGIGGQVLADEPGKRPFADKANSGAVLFLRDWQTGVPCELPHVALEHFAQRKQRLPKVALFKRVQKIALILARVPALVQFDPPVPPPLPVPPALQPRVVPCREPFSTETSGILPKRAELDLPVAQHIGIGCPAPAQFVQEIGEHAFLVLGGEVDPVQGQVQATADAPRILEVPRGLAIAVILPVAHVQALHVMAGVAKQHGAYRRVHTARQGNNDQTVTFHGADFTLNGRAAEKARRSGLHCQIALSCQ